MSSEVCLSGCTVRGSHLADCSGEDCWGCTPRLAEYGTLCVWCWQRLNGAVTDVPRTVERLHRLADGSPRSPSARGSRSSGSRVLYDSALVAADDLAAMFGTWADLIVSEHPAGLSGPGRAGWQFTSRRVRAVDGELVIDGESRVRGSVAAVDRMASWMRDLLSWAAGQPWAAEMKSELGSAVARIDARWPFEETPHLSPVACPECGGQMTYEPPSTFGAPAKVCCIAEDCGQFWIESQWKRAGLIGAVDIEVEE